MLAMLTCTRVYPDKQRQINYNGQGGQGARNSKILI